MACDAPTDTNHRESPLPRQPRVTPSPDAVRDNDDHPPQINTTSPMTPRTTSRRTGRTLRPTQPRSGATGPPWVRRPRVAAPPHLRHQPAHPSDHPGPGATLGEGVKHFLSDTFLHVAPHDCPPLATPDGESPPPTGSRIWVPCIDWRRHLVGQPVPGRVNSKGRPRNHKPDMAQTPPSATPRDTKDMERVTWVDRMASLSNFRHQVPGDVPTPDHQQPAPSQYMNRMYNIHYTLSTTHYHAPTGHWVMHGTDSLLPADYAPPLQHNPSPNTYTREEKPDQPHIWGTWGRHHHLHHHNHLIHHHHHVLVQHSTPQAAGKTSQTGPQTRPHREQPRRRQGPRPNEARARSPAETQDSRQATTQSGQRTTTSTRSQTQAQAQARRHDGSTSPTPGGRPLQHPVPAIPGPAAAAPNTATPHRHRRRPYHLHGRARRGRGATRFVPPPLKAHTPGPGTSPDQTRTAPGSTSSVPAPLPTVDVSPNTANAPLPPPP